jgi:Transglycosylase SLT domain
VSLSGKLKIAVLTTASALATMAIGAIPNASADDTCTVTVVLVSGQTLNFTVSAPAGTPPSQLVPAGVGPVQSVTASCVPATTTTTPMVSVTTTPTTTTTTTTTSTTPQSSIGTGVSVTRKPTTGSSTQKVTPRSPDRHVKTSTTTSTTKAARPSSGSLGVGVGSVFGLSGVRSFSLSVPGPAFGVPNFFVGAFEVPPFLLPIYQAAGIEWDVPWQVLAAINEIETDYGRNLSVSSAGAVGWMQFLPSTWARYGVDATGSGYADPYNPVDAIFAAARYLHAAGASRDLSGAIYSYNHAWWYVESVMLRARLIEGVPSALVGALSGLVEGRFPVAAPARYADDRVISLAARRVSGSDAAITVDSAAGVSGAEIFAGRGSPVIAVSDGKVIAVGRSRALGSYLELQDATGNVYTYADLGGVARFYPVPKPERVTAGEIARQLALPATPAPKGPATAGSQRLAATPSASEAASEAVSGRSSSLPVSAAVAGGPSRGRAADPAAGGSAGAVSQVQVVDPMLKERLFADPSRPASYAAGGEQQLAPVAPAIGEFQDYFSGVLHLAKDQYTLEPLRAGAIVVAGTILGRVGAAGAGDPSHVVFMIRPAGRDAPYIDPGPILDGWKLLEQTAVYRAQGADPFVGKDPSIGQVLLMSKEQLEGRVLSDPRVRIYACGRRDIQAGLIDRRVLAVLEFLADSGLDPTVSGLECGHEQSAADGVDPQGATGESVDISKINGIAIEGHQGPGSITDLTIRRLLTLQGTFRPQAIVSATSYRNQPNTIAEANHADRIQIAYTQLYGNNNKLSHQLANLLGPSEWTQLINQLTQIPEPTVPTTPSQYAIKDAGGA